MLYLLFIPLFFTFKTFLAFITRYMRPLLFSLLTILSVSLFQGCAYSVLQADKALEKNKMSKAKKRIDKAVDKNSENPAAQFMLAKYYSHPVWSFDAVDSAHLYIQLVSDTFPNLDTKTTKKLAKKGLDSMAARSLALVIDSLAFEKALAMNTAASYNQYLNEYQELTYKENATELRNQLAYQDAIAQNTAQAMSEFFRMYPDAPQAKKARSVFETLYYEKKTQNGSVSEYIDYLQERPQSDYAEEAAAKLLRISSAGADFSDYQQFANRFAQFEAGKTALLVLEGLNYQEESPELMVYKKDGIFSFYNLEQSQLLDFQLDNVLPDSCSFIKQPFILNTEENVTYAYLKNGVKLTDANIKAIEYVGSGFFKINDYGRKQTLVHYSLIAELSQKALDFYRIDDFHFAKKEKDGWHLVSLLNEPILHQPMDSIWKEKDMFFFQKGTDIAVASVRDFKKSAKDDLKSLSFLYDEYEWLGEEYLKLYSNDYQTVLDGTTEVIFPLEKTEFDFLDDLWVVGEQGQFNVFDLEKKTLFEEQFDDYQYRSGILALKKTGKWSVFSNNSYQFPEFQYDSVRIFNSWLTYAVQGAAEYLLFHSGKKIRVEEGEIFKILKNYNVAFSEIVDQLRFVQVANEKGYFKLYNAFGTKIREGEKLDINVLSPRLVQVHQAKKKQLIDSAGNLIVVKDVDAFGAYQHGLIPILKGRKFGALVVNDMKIIPAHSESKLEVFLKDSLFIFKKDDLWGISNSSGKVVLAADFEAIDYFNDSTAIVEKKGEMGMLNIYQKEYVQEQIFAWERIIFDDESYFIVRKSAGYGVLNQRGEEIVPAIFNELNAHKSKGELFWLAERRLSEINYIVIAYFDKIGHVLFKEGLNFDDYLESTCD